MKKIILTVGALGLAGGLAYYLWKKYSSSPAPAKTSSATASTTSTQQAKPAISGASNSIWVSGINEAKQKIFASSGYLNLVPASQMKVKDMLDNLDKQSILDQSAATNTSVTRLIMNIVSQQWSKIANAATAGRDNPPAPITTYFGFEG